VKNQLWRKVGLSLIVLGGLLLALAVSYYIYVSLARVHLEELVVKPTPTQMPAQTLTPPVEAATQTLTQTATHTTQTQTQTPTQTVTQTTQTQTQTLTQTTTQTPTQTPTQTATQTTQTPTQMPTQTTTQTLTQTPTQTATQTPTQTPTQTATQTTQTQTPTQTATQTTQTQTQTPAQTATQTSQTPTQTPTQTATQTQTPSQMLPPPVHIDIPSIGVHATVVEGGLTEEGGTVTFWDPPGDIVAHLSGSPNPGMKGNMIMYGHKSRLLVPSVFYNLLNIQIGDEIIIQNEAGDSFVYEVIPPRILEGADYYAIDKYGGDWILVDPGHVWVLSPSEEPILTLITCEPPELYTLRLVVTARLVSS